MQMKILLQSYNLNNSRQKSRRPLLIVKKSLGGNSAQSEYYRKSVDASLMQEGNDFYLIHLCINNFSSKIRLNFGKLLVWLPKSSLKLTVRRKK